MRVLVGKTFGIGNACLAIPMIKAIASLGHHIDVLVGSGPDDFGAAVVFRELQLSGTIDAIHIDCAPISMSYDVAIMAIPYDGRWRNGIEFSAKRLMDCRRRPGNVERLGFDMWEKHEVEYMMENARELGFEGETPDGSFLGKDVVDSNVIYLGIGYKRDPGGFGRSKHFGNYRFSELTRHILDRLPDMSFISSGPMIDFVESARKICSSNGRYDHVTTTSDSLGLSRSFNIVSRCAAYVGNDTGMMHVAASLGIPTMGLFAYPGLIIKNPPFCARSSSILFDGDDPTAESIADRFVELIGRDRCAS